MARITDKERKRFHKYLDESIDKMDSSKNSKKDHWKRCGILHLTRRQIDECNELSEAVFKHKFSQKNIESECFDNINFPLMIIDNLRGNK